MEKNARVTFIKFLYENYSNTLNALNRGGKEVDARRETRESRPQTGKASETNEKQGR